MESPNHAFACVNVKRANVDGKAVGEGRIVDVLEKESSKVTGRTQALRARLCETRAPRPDRVPQSALESKNPPPYPKASEG